MKIYENQPQTTLFHPILRFLEHRSQPNNKYKNIARWLALQMLSEFKA